MLYVISNDNMGPILCVNHLVLHYQVTEVTGTPDEEIDVLAIGTNIVIEFTPVGATSVSVGKTSVIACGGVSKSCSTHLFICVTCNYSQFDSTKLLQCCIG